MEFLYKIVEYFIASGRKSFASLDSIDESIIPIRLYDLFIISSPCTNIDFVFISNIGIRLSKTFEFACCKLSKIIIQFFSFFILESIPSNNKDLISLKIILPSFSTGIFLQNRSSTVVLFEILKYIISYPNIFAR